VPLARETSWHGAEGNGDDEDDDGIEEEDSTCLDEQMEEEEYHSVHVLVEHVVGTFHHTYCILLVVDIDGSRGVLHKDDEEHDKENGAEKGTVDSDVGMLAFHSTVGPIHVRTD